MELRADRRRVLAAGAALAAGACAGRTEPEPDMPNRDPDARTQPVLFIGHGSPMNAIEDNRWSRAFRALALELPRPRAVLAVSAHWYGRGSWVTAQERPETIHDFGGFPQALFDVDYPAPGAPELARRVRELAGAEVVRESVEWGLDHGTWSVLVHLLPAADVPVVQLSLDASLSPQEHLALAERLRPLPAEGVLVLGSGNAVHNLGDAFARMGAGDETVPEWSAAFDADVARACAERDSAFLARALETPAGRRSHPTAEHYLPLLYAAGAAHAGAQASFPPVTFPVTGFDHSLSMRSVRFG